MTDGNGDRSHPPVERLHDWAEGVLPSDQREGVAEHIGRCAECAAEVEAVRSLRAALAGLPRRIDPGDDLRPGIHRRIAHAGRAGTRAPRVAIAAVLVAGFAGVLAYALGGPPSVTGSAGHGGGVAGVTETIRSLDREYARAEEELQRLVSGGGLPPEAAGLVREDLTTVERALEASRAALLRDPESEAAWRLLLSVHRQRLDVLRRATTLLTETEGAT
jgi:hypothetical protein